MNAQRLVGLSSPLMRNAQLNLVARGTSVGGMKNRFPDDRRTTWRQRFLAIAREMEAAAPRRESIAAVQAARRKFFADRSLRGIRLGCVRAV